VEQSRGTCASAGHAASTFADESRLFSHAVSQEISKFMACVCSDIFVSYYSSRAIMFTGVDQWNCACGNHC